MNIIEKITGNKLLEDHEDIIKRRPSETFKTQCKCGNIITNYVREYVYIIENKKIKELKNNKYKLDCSHCVRANIIKEDFDFALLNKIIAPLKLVDNPKDIIRIMGGNDKVTIKCSCGENFKKLAIHQIKNIVYKEGYFDTIPSNLKICKTCASATKSKKISLANIKYEKIKCKMCNNSYCKEDINKNGNCKYCIYKSHKRKPKHHKRLKKSRRKRNQQKLRDMKIAKINIQTRLKLYKEFKHKLNDNILKINYIKSKPFISFSYVTKCCGRTHIIGKIPTHSHCCPYCNYTNGKILSSENDKAVSINDKMIINACELFDINCGKCGKITQNKSLSDIRYNKIFCDTCKKQKSKGENIIASILDKEKILYVQEKTFDELKSDKNYALRFDFYIKELNLAIEYDGELHFTETNWFGKEVFENLQKNDKKKTFFCDINNINLLRIGYKQINNLDKIIINEMREYNENKNRGFIQIL